MTYADSFVAAIRDYLTANGLKSLGQINAAILKDIAQRHFDHWQAQQKAETALKRRNKASTPSDTLPDAEWLKTLSESPANSGIDVQAEFARAQLWVKNQPGRRFTRRFFLKWLLKADRALPTHDASPTHTSHPSQHVNRLYSLPSFDYPRLIATSWPRDQFPDRAAWEEMPWGEIPITVRQELLRIAK